MKFLEVVVVVVAGYLCGAIKTNMKTDMKRIEAVEMWIWRKMEKISWTAKVSNSEVLNRVNENRCIISMINQRKCRWLGHVLWHDVLLWDALEGRMTGKCTRGRKRLQLMSNICEWYEKAKKRAEDRVCDVSQWWESLTCYYSRIPAEEEELKRKSLCAGVTLKQMGF